MSRAFIKEDAGDDHLPERPQPSGQDEAAAGGDAISWDSVLARAFIGRKTGETLLWIDGEIEKEIKITFVEYLI